MSQYIGKTISLISNKGLRYVGVLDKISADDATVSLKSVRPFGTEGRMAEQGQPNLEVMPGSDVYEYVVFRGSDVKDLNVLDTPIDQVRPVSYYAPPATAGSPPATATTARNAPLAPGPTHAAPPVHRTAPTHPTNGVEPNTTRGQPATGHYQAPPSASPAAMPAPPRETGYPQASKVGNPHTSAPAATPSRTDTGEPTQTAIENATAGAAPSAPTSMDDDYDFEEANRRFEREKQLDADAKPTYDKKSLFFDSISLNERNGNLRWQEEKSLNMDTFGEAYARRGRGGSRGRGGRGRGNGYKGRGRGSSRGRAEAKPEWA